VNGVAEQVEREDILRELELLKVWDETVFYTGRTRAGVHGDFTTLETDAIRKCLQTIRNLLK